MHVHCYAAQEAKGYLEPFEYEPQPLGPDDVEIRIVHCGVCYTDVHLIDNDWGISSYPLVPGHEIIGVISAKGNNVRNLDTGQRVGVGSQRSSCGFCEWCIRGEEHLCPDRKDTCLGGYGGFAQNIRIDGRFAFPLPDALPSESSAPLMCAGITVYSPLRRYVQSPSTRVGVIGIGGLGHFALQFASAFGCHVTAFSTSPDKERHALSFGASRFIHTADAEQMEAALNSIDLLISTVPAALDWNSYLKTLRPGGVLCLAGVHGNIDVPANSLLFGQKAITATSIGSRSMIREMLEFAARHPIGATVESMPLKAVNRAIETLRQNKARYRIVLNM